MKIGLRIKERRKELGMSADKLGEILGKDRSTIYRYEKGDIENLPLDILEPIAAALHTTPAYLMGWDEAIKKDPVGTAERHFEVLMDEDFISMFDDFRSLSPKQKKLVTDFVHNMANLES
jgi:transcriptional regulator with XRE-family HTH domain